MTTPAVIATPRVQLLMDWLTSIGWDVTQESGYPLFPGPEILPEPDKAVFLTPTPGPGFLTEEGGVDAWGFQVRLRGAADDPLGAQAAAQLLDWMILTASFPVVVDSAGIRSVHRLGATPVPLPLDQNDRRFEYACDYIIVTGVN